MVAAGEADRGILVCSTGIGMAMAANKIAGRPRRAGANDEDVELTRRTTTPTC